MYSLVIKFGRPAVRGSLAIEARGLSAVQAPRRNQIRAGNVLGRERTWLTGSPRFAFGVNLAPVSCDVFPRFLMVFGRAGEHEIRNGGNQAQVAGRLAFGTKNAGPRPESAVNLETGDPWCISSARADSGTLPLRAARTVMALRPGPRAGRPRFGPSRRDRPSRSVCRDWPAVCCSRYRRWPFR
jgi:hypothetical protein